MAEAAATSSASAPTMTKRPAVLFEQGDEPNHDNLVRIAMAPAKIAPHGYSNVNAEMKEGRGIGR